jgi:hypothetical protein
VQLVKAGALSSLHVKLLGSVAVNVKLALVDAVGFVGLVTIVVSGGPVSTVQLKLLVSEGLPAASRARTLKVWVPWVRPVKVFVPAVPEPQEANRALSTRQEKAPGSLLVQVKVAVVVVAIAAGVEPIVIVGATVSVVQVKVAGVGSTLPAASMPRAWKVWEPSGKLASGIETGELQDVNAVLSRLHSSVASASVWIVNEAAVLFGSGGLAVKAVSGTTVSIVQLNVAGVGSLLPALSVAATLKVCRPSARPL